MAEDKYKTPPDLQERLDRDTNKHIDRDKKIRESEGLEGQEKIDKLQDAAKTRLRGEQLMDNLVSYIDTGMQKVVETAATDDPDSYWDDAARAGLGAAQWVGNVASTPGISHTLRVLDSPFWVARQSAGGVLEHGLGVDPRYGHAAVGVGEFFVGGKALTGVAKKAKHVHQMSGLSRAYKKGTKFIPDTAILPRQRELGLQMMATIDDGPTFRQLRTQFDWEIQRGNPRIFQANRTTPQPLNTSEFLLSGKQKLFTKQDIDLRGYNLSSRKSSVKKFSKEIDTLLEADRIEARNVPAGMFGKLESGEPSQISQALRKVWGFQKGNKGINKGINQSIEEITELYSDYLAGYFFQHIAGGLETDFSKAAKLILPDGTKIGQFDKVMKRELKVMAIAPDVYKSGAFKSKNNKELVANLIAEYTFLKLKPSKLTKNAKIRPTGKYKINLHHMDHIAEGFPLYKGLDSAGRAEMRQLVTSLGLNPGNHPANRLALLDRYHDALHNRFWPKELERLKTKGWQDLIDNPQKYPDVASRKALAEAYVKSIKASTADAVEQLDRALDYKTEKALDAYMRSKGFDAPKKGGGPFMFKTEEGGADLPKSIPPSG